MRYWIGALAAFFLALIQASSVEQFRVLGVAPNLLLVFLVAWLVVRGLDDVLPMIAVSGITLGLVGLQIPGLVLLALLPIAGLGVIRELRVIQSDALLALALVGAATVAYESIILAAVIATGGTFDPVTGFEHVVLPAAIVNVLLMPFVYAVMQFARRPERRGQYSF